ncbi:hypothetical protein ElyMa_006787900 [Elysia marginata]|uniref:Uncharacterized protein n=1 Tax=Elysia marginata TaxID=1093978 RepID=A0AAV4J2I8_9GAST|nr:hypothetical protein ElyMa_006787900 [Elysia marginata]
METATASTITGVKVNPYSSVPGSVQIHCLDGQRMAHVVVIVVAAAAELKVVVVVVAAAVAVKVVEVTTAPVE